MTPYTQNQTLNRFISYLRALNAERVYYPIRLVRFGDEASNRKCFDEELRCQVCDGLARPNVLMFDDDRWVNQVALSAEP